ncbi:MAG: CoA-binding protein, partial [Hyphomicrobiales bacterium]|nr:CoA-binding protein [Hyphomicrobiales bacterium]
MWKLACAARGSDALSSLIYAIFDATRSALIRDRGKPVLRMLALRVPIGGSSGAGLARRRSLAQRHLLRALVGKPLLAPIMEMLSAMLDALFRPRSIAVVGASTDPTKLGSLPVKFMLGAGYGGELYPVNPRASTIQGLPVFSSVKAIGQKVDLAIIAVPKEFCAAALADCAEAGVAAAIMFTSGFAEVDTA